MCLPSFEAPCEWTANTPFSMAFHTAVIFEVKKELFLGIPEMSEAMLLHIGPAHFFTPSPKL